MVRAFALSFFFYYTCSMYKSKLKEGLTVFNGFKVMWAGATQAELKKVYDLGFTNFVSKEDAKPKKTKAKAKEESSKDNSDKE
jgi:hypothetical protein|tara:strand:- start:1006 stop:1254 length:249 start_codon:yes stop_codon:yes gene_type:complete